MDTKYIIGIIAVIIIAIIAGAVLMGGSHTERADDGLVVAAYSHGGEPEAGFDPILGWNYYAEPLIQSTLLKMTKGMDYENDLATSWEANSDFTEYTVKLRDKCLYVLVAHIRRIDRAARSHDIIQFLCSAQFLV
jgi:peptide/nickel transport system substrate-binding protein